MRVTAMASFSVRCSLIGAEAAARCLRWRPDAVLAAVAVGRVCAASSSAASSLPTRQLHFLTAPVACFHSSAARRSAADAAAGSASSCAASEEVWSVLKSAVLQLPPSQPVNDGSSGGSSSAVRLSGSASRPRHQLRPAVTARPELLITTAEQLQALTALLQARTVLALDCEFISFPCYRPTLQVLQIASADVVAVIDFPLLAASPELPLLLQTVMSKTVILHSAKGDLELLYALSERYGLRPRVPPSVFDTQAVAAYAGYGSLIGYSRLLSELYGLTVDKSETLTDWSRRPLTAAQLRYCLNDVLHLHSMRDDLMAELQALGRWQWAEEELRCISNELLYAPPAPSDAWRSVFEARKLSEHGDELAVLRAVCRLRELVCRQRDLAAVLLFRNQQAAAIAVQKPGSMDELRQVQGLKPWVVRRYGQQLLQAVREALASDADSRADLYHRLGHKQAGRLHEGLFNLLSSRVQTVAEQQGLSVFHLAPRQEVMDLASVSIAAVNRLRALPLQQLQPVPMVSHFFNTRYELLPHELSTSPRCLYRRRGEAEEEQPTADNPLARRLSVDDEVEMLSRLKLLSGWRRQVIGEDLLDIVCGQSLQWQTTTANAVFEEEGEQHRDDGQHGDDTSGSATQQRQQRQQRQQEGSSERPLSRLRDSSSSTAEQDAAVQLWLSSLSADERDAVWTAVASLVRQLDCQPSSSTSAPSAGSAKGTERVAQEVRQVIERRAASRQQQQQDSRDSSISAVHVAARSLHADSCDAVRCCPPLETG